MGEEELVVWSGGFSVIWVRWRLDGLYRRRYCNGNCVISIRNSLVGVM